MFDRLLIANRGEIAVRIIRACQELDIHTVAVYSEADGAALHTRLAGEAVLIGPPAPAESYLCIDKILEAAQQTGCDAVHPGYGFLAENADFAAAVTAAGLTFVGPHPDAIRTMGSKTLAREAMAAAGVPIVPGYQQSQRDEALLAAAQKIGFPILVKAIAGGGGKGMRVVHAAADLPYALQSARREALNAFGDDQVYLEKYLPDPHHIEFQIFGDRFGHVVHLFERECSVQRRHQKIIEETPSPLLDDDLRRRMGEAAVAAAKAVNYANAGTIEFLVDANRNFYFLEMNTRLQVEHPITELAVGVDLVKWQLRVAAGEPLPAEQSQLTQRGHALECRLYAEDPTHNFLPSTGRILRVIEPSGPGIRVDSGLAIGDEITIHYDPLLAKLSVLAENRTEAIDKMERALRQYVILGGVTTNVPFLRDVIRHPAFQLGQTTTEFIDRHFADWQPAEMSIPDEVLVAAAIADTLNGANGAAGPDNEITLVQNQDPYSPWQQMDNFRVGQSSRERG